MKRGDEVWLRRADGELARFRVSGVGAIAVRGVWLDGALKGREANVDRAAFAAMIAAAKRNRVDLRALADELETNPRDLTPAEEDAIGEAMVEERLDDPPDDAE